MGIYCISKETFRTEKRLANVHCNASIVSSMRNKFYFKQFPTKKVVYWFFKGLMKTGIAK